MRHYVQRRLLRVRQVHQLHMARLPAGERQDRVVAVRTQHAKALIVRVRLEDVQLLRTLRESVHFDDALQHDDDPIASQAHPQHGRIELQTDRRRLLQIVPHNHAVRRVQRPRAASNER